MPDGSPLALDCFLSTPCTCYATARAHRCTTLHTSCTWCVAARAHRCTTLHTSCTCCVAARADRCLPLRTPCTRMPNGTPASVIHFLWHTARAVHQIQIVIPAPAFCFSLCDLTLLVARHHTAAGGALALSVPLALPHPLSLSSNGREHAST